MRYALNDVHKEAAKVALDQIGPCTLIDLAKHLKQQSVCCDLDNVAFVCQLRKLADSGELDSSKITKAKLIGGLTNSEKEAIQNITAEAAKSGTSYTFAELAQLVADQTNENSSISIEQKIRFLFIPMYSRGHDDEEHSS